jgi:hypothetical protein
MDHLHNSSDLVPNDFHLFGCLKKHLVGKRFATDASMKLSSPDYRHWYQFLLYWAARIGAMV